MSENNIQGHTFGPRDRGGIVFGLRGGQIGVLTIGLVLMTFAVRGVSSVLGAVIGLAVFGLAMMVAFLPIRRRTLDQWVPIFAGYFNRSMSGHTRWLSKAHLQGHLAQLQEGAQELLPPRDQPPGLKGVEILSVTSEGLGGEVGILKDGRLFIAVLAAYGQSFA